MTQGQYETPPQYNQPPSGQHGTAHRPNVGVTFTPELAGTVLAILGAIAIATGVIAAFLTLGITGEGTAKAARFFEDLTFGIGLGSIGVAAGLTVRHRASR
jgi:hypothetical protein